MSVMVRMVQGEGGGHPWDWKVNPEGVPGLEGTYTLTAQGTEVSKKDAAWLADEANREAVGGRVFERGSLDSDGQWVPADPAPSEPSAPLPGGPQDDIDGGGDAAAETKKGRGGRRGRRSSSAAGSGPADTKE